MQFEVEATPRFVGAWLVCYNNDNNDNNNNNNSYYSNYKK
jgi:hypothetical protein